MDIKKAEGKFTRFHMWFILYCAVSTIGFLGLFVIAPIIEGSIADVFDAFGQGYFMFLIVGIVFVFLAALSYYLKYELTVTETKVVGKTLLGKRVDLPIAHISAIGMGWFNRITITSSSGHVTFYGVLNQQEINDVITSLIRNKEDNKTENTTIVAPTTSNAEELKKYKDLLDSGIITQEEFDAKKKQLLGL